MHKKLAVCVLVVLLSSCGGGAATPSADVVQTAIAQTVVASSPKSLPTDVPKAIPTSAPVATRSVPTIAPLPTLAEAPTKPPAAKPTLAASTGSSSSGGATKSDLTAEENVFLTKAYNVLKEYLAAMEEFDGLNTDLFNNTSLLGDSGWRSKINASLDRVRAASYAMSHIDPMPSRMLQINIKLNQLDSETGIFLGHYVNGFNQRDIYLLRETEKDAQDIQSYYDQLIAEVMKVLPDSAKSGQPPSGVIATPTRLPAAKATSAPASGAQPKPTLSPSSKAYLDKVAQISKVYKTAMDQFEQVLADFENNESVLTDTGWKQRAKAASDTMDKAIGMLNDLGAPPPGMGLVDLNLRSVLVSAGLMLTDFSAGVNMNSAPFMEQALSDLKLLKTSSQDLYDELEKVLP